jgi:hypothetical protein
MSLYYIIYSSIPEKTFRKEDVEALLATARENNERFEITGMLVYLPEIFIQLIEGPKAEILQLYQNIEQDNRHYRVTLLKDGPIRRRSFPDWSMGLDYHDVPLSDLRQSFPVSDDKIFSLFNILDAPPGSGE